MQFSAMISVVLLWAIGMFQLLMLFGFPPGKCSLGRVGYSLLRKLRIVSAFSAPVLLIATYFFLQQGKFVPFQIHIIIFNANFAFK